MPTDLDEIWQRSVVALVGYICGFNTTQIGGWAAPGQTITTSVIFVNT